MGNILISSAIDLTKDQPWHKLGYGVVPLYPKNESDIFYHTVDGLLRKLWLAGGLDFSKQTQLDQYHTVAADSSAHLSVINQTRLVSSELFPMGIAKLEERISAIMGTPLHVLNPYDGQSVFHFRVIRPQSTDNNPIHRDVWLEDYADCVNLYIPIAGSNEKSSLTLIPESHLWPEEDVDRTPEGALVNGIKFNVPAVTRIKRPHEIVRPNPGLNEVLIFSPYLLHGGALNLNNDTTRISIEVRLWKK